MTHDELMNALGAYALGQLDDPVLRAEVESHVATCAECRRELELLSPLAARLDQVDPDVAAPPAVTPPPELDRRMAQLFGDVGEASVTPLRATRTRRWPIALVGAVVGAAAATAATLALQDPSPPPVPNVIAVAQVGTSAGIDASAGLVDHTWGVEVKLQMSGLEAGERYAFQVVGDDGSVREAGEVRGVSDATVTCSMSSSILLADAASFDVVDESGTTVVWGDIAS